MADKRRGPKVGSGGQGRRALQGKGPTPSAEFRPGHPAARRARKTDQRSGGEPRGGARGEPRGAARGEPRGAARGEPRDSARGDGRRGDDRRGDSRGGAFRRGTGVVDGPELLIGRNPVVESLRSAIPATALYVAKGLAPDERVTEALRGAGDRGLPVLEVSRAELDRLTGGLLHQGLALQVPPFAYLALEDLLARTVEDTGLLVALDGVTDPRNLGAVVRSAAAFGAHGVVVPERRAAGMTASAWRTSAGAAARIPVSRVTNMTRSLRACQDHGLMVIGLDAGGEVSLDDLEVAVDPIVVVIGSEGRGLSRLVGETCDLRVRIPIASDVESLNASVAAAVTLAEIARRRRLHRLAAPQ